VAAYLTAAHEPLTHNAHAALLKDGHIAWTSSGGIKEIEFLSDPSVGQVRIGCPESMTAGFVSTVANRLRIDIHELLCGRQRANRRTGASRGA
jgi:hypothetical protein